MKLTWRFCVEGGGGGQTVRTRGKLRRSHMEKNFLRHSRYFFLLIVQFIDTLTYETNKSLIVLFLFLSNVNPPRPAISQISTFVELSLDVCDVC
jgi:hypothetical protein